MNETARILGAISPDEPMHIWRVWHRVEFASPSTMTGDEIRDKLETIATLGDQGLVTITRDSSGRIETLKLTSLGIERAREAAEGAEQK